MVGGVTTGLTVGAEGGRIIRRGCWSGWRRCWRGIFKWPRLRIF